MNRNDRRSQVQRQALGSRTALWLSVLVVGLMAVTPPAMAADRSNDDGVTPLPLAPGRPVGSFPLSGFDSITPFSGRVNASIPLLQIGGRGQAGAVVELRVPDASWRFRSARNSSGEILFYPSFETWSGNWQRARYSPGVMLRRPSFELGIRCDLYSHHSLAYLLMRINFIKADGTEIEFRGRGHNITTPYPLGAVGEQVLATGDCATVPPRAEWDPTFVAVDGSGATFIAASSIVQTEGESTASSIDGWLYLKNGTRYRITSGNVDTIIDRNGNTIAYTYGTAGNGNREVQLIRDSLGREVKFKYHETCWSEGSPTDCDRITYTGAGGASRTIEVAWSRLGSRGRPLRLGAGCAVGQCTLAELFPNLCGYKRYNGTPRLQGCEETAPFEVPAMLAWIQLPTGGAGTYRYDFYYNRLGELAAVRLPTSDNGGGVVYEEGGLIEYDWEDYGSGILVAQDSQEVMVPKRRVVERRELTGTILKGDTFIEYPQGLVGEAGVSVKVRDCVIHDGAIGDADKLGRLVKHFYYGDIDSALRIRPNGYPHWKEGREFKTETYDGTSAGCTKDTNPENGSPLKTVVNTWDQRPPRPGEERPNDLAWAAWDVRLVKQETTLGSVTSTVDYTYDEYNNVTGETVNDFSGRGLLRETTRTYDLTWAAPALGHQRSLLTSESVAGPTGATETTTSFLYDEGQLTEYPPVVVGYERPEDVNPWIKRGNPTRITVCSPEPYAGCHSTALQYDQLGNVLNKTVADGEGADAVSTTFSFKDRYANPAPGQGCELSGFAGNTGEGTYAFATEVAKAGFVTKLIYERYWGKPIRVLRPTGVVDEANSTSDPFDRVTSVRYGCGLDEVANKPQLIEYAYMDVARQVRVRRQQTPDVAPSWARKEWRESKFDVLGREDVSWQIGDDVNGQDHIFVYTLWDGLGRKAAVSNPKRGSDPLRHTIMLYDGLDRIRSVAISDVRTASSDVGQPRSVTTTSYANDTVTVVDPQNHKKTSVLDALGRVVQVTEWNGSTSFATDYTYDARGNLLSARQGPPQTRTFEYDGFGLLRQAVTPEAGRTTYEYDARGNLRTKVQYGDGGSSLVTVSMSYDKLDRILSKTYTSAAGIASPSAVSYRYDEYGGFNQGRLTRVWNAESATSYRYDSLGHLRWSGQAVGSKVYQFSYDFDRLGYLTSQTYPSGRVVTTDVDRMGQVREVRETTPTPRLLAAMPRVTAAPYPYAENGTLLRMDLGNSLQYRATIWPGSLMLQGVRLQTAGSALIGAFRYNYGDVSSTSGIVGNDGNVMFSRTTVSATGGDHSFDQYLYYDGLDRLTTMSELLVRPDSSTTFSLSQTNGYDRWGNRWVSAQTGTGFPSHWATPMSGAEFDTNTNRISNTTKAAYDSLGNDTMSPTQGQAVKYDAEGRVVEATGGTTTARYEYDGAGRRVKQAVNGAETVFVYDGLGRLAVEHGVTQAPPDITYVTSDVLGSVRIVTNAAGGVVSRHDFAPFGEQIANPLRTDLKIGAVGIGYERTDALRHRFTGKERDAATRLDYFGARYFSSQQGRFMSPDPALQSGRIGLPQSWNRYAYALGNPLRYVDPFGLWDLDILQGMDKKGRPTVEVYAVKSNDKDDAGTLAGQLGLSADDAKSWTVGERVRLADVGGTTGRVYKRVEGGLTEQLRFDLDPKNAEKIASGRQSGPMHSDCSRTAAEVGGVSFGQLQVGANILDKSIAEGAAGPVPAGNERVGDIVRFANQDNTPTHFANFVFRTVDAQAMAYSKNGITGPYNLRSVESLQVPMYGTVRGQNKGETGYYR